jgi:exopolyphosphatase/guanosine-5'-triphosphate,3'-diphosphate pyrophosphatase
MKIAAIDIGSNSTHMVIVRAVEGQHLEVIDREKEFTRLGAGLRDNRLAKDAADRTILTLRRFKQIAEANRVDLVLTTATAAVREAQNGDKFIERVRKEVGLDAQIIPGVEEARLVALAVSEVTDFNNRRALIIDIGGGSTEFIITSGGEPELLMSVKLGSVRLTEKFITKDPPSKSEREQLVAYVRSVLSRAAVEIKQKGFDFVIGTSGTILNLTDAIVQSEAADAGDESEFQAFSQAITLEQIARMNRKLAQMDIHQRRVVPGLEEQRADIIIAGGLLLETILSELGIHEITQCEWSLREGSVLNYQRKKSEMQSGAGISSGLFITSDDNGRAAKLDVRTRSVLSVARHFEYDAPHSHHIAKLASQLFEETRSIHGLGDAELTILQYASLLHDIGYRIAHNDHHRHGLYLIKNSEMPGFTANEIAMIAAVVRYHRGTMPKKSKHKRAKREHEDYYALKRQQRLTVLKLAAILQIADGLDRSYMQKVQSIRCEVNKDKVKIICQSSDDCDLEIWSAERKAKWFKDLFRVSVKFQANKTAEQEQKPLLESTPIGYSVSAD